MLQLRLLHMEELPTNFRIVGIFFFFLFLFDNEKYQLRYPKKKKNKRISLRQRDYYYLKEKIERGKFGTIKWENLVQILIVFVIKLHNDII